MYFFELELSKVIKYCKNVKDPQYAGRACIGKVNGDVRVRIEFISKSSNSYSDIKVTLINCKEGPIDAVTIRFEDLFGKKKVDNPNFKDGIVPHIWRYSSDDKWEWYVYHLTEEDYKMIAWQINTYLEAFI